MDITHLNMHAAVCVTQKAQHERELIDLCTRYRVTKNEAPSDLKGLHELLYLEKRLFLEEKICKLSEEIRRTTTQILIENPCSITK
jgi:hypothetical protein